MTKLNSVDKIYHSVLEELLSAPIRGDRTGTGTRSVFGRQFRFSNLENEFPLITTKKVWFKGIFHELKWMLMGDTNIKYLVDNGVSIWTDWPLRNYNYVYAELGQKEPVSKDDFENWIRGDTDGVTKNFAKTWGDCGPVYGMQWRRWLGHSSKPIDQIADVINQLRTNPESRRMIVNAWNVADIPEMIPSGLPPCHYTFQFYTRPIPNEKRRSIGASRAIFPVDSQLTACGIPERFLDCMVCIRSNDAYLGKPFNIAQYALLTHLMAKTVNMVPGELVYTVGDLHLYKNHEDQAREQLARSSSSMSLPKLEILCMKDDPKDYEWEDLKLTNYNPHSAIKAQIAV